MVSSTSILDASLSWEIDPGCDCEIPGPYVSFPQSQLTSTGLEFQPPAHQRCPASEMKTTAADMRMATGYAALTLAAVALPALAQAPRQGHRGHFVLEGRDGAIQEGVREAYPGRRSRSRTATPTPG